jgi:hypothetical protein
MQLALVRRKDAIPGFGSHWDPSSEMKTKR